MAKRDPMQKRLTRGDKASIAKESLTSTQKELAIKYNVSQPTISKCLTKSEQRDIIKQETAKLVQALPSILQAQLNEIKTSQQLLEAHLHPNIDNVTDCPLNEFEDILALRKYTQSNERELLKSMGILPTQTTNQYIAQIYQDNRNSVIGKDVLRFLGLNYTASEDQEEDIEIIDEAEIVSQDE